MNCSKSIPGHSILLVFEIFECISRMLQQVTGKLQCYFGSEKDLRLKLWPATVFVVDYVGSGKVE